MRLPIELIDFVLDHLNETTRGGDLAALLRVNKAFFKMSVRRLYYDPTRAIKSSSRPFTAAQKFLVRVLRYSPAQDADVQSLRVHLSKDLDDLHETPTLDYLAFIKSIPYHPQVVSGLSFTVDPHSDEDDFRNLRYYGVALHDILVWAACGHRLPDVHDIDISWNSLARYHPCIGSLTSMQSIRLSACAIPYPLFRYWSNDEVATLHGSLQSVLCFVDKWLEAWETLGDSRPYVEFQLADTNKRQVWWEHEPFSGELQKIFKRIPVTAFREINAEDKLEWARFCMAPHKFNLSRVQSIVVADGEHVARTNWRWPEKGMGAILQECRSLRWLELHIPFEENVFGWAARERQEATLSLRANPRLVPLTELTLVICDSLLWQDAVYGFGTTLRKVSIHVYQDSYHAVDLGLFHDMPQLHSLTVSTSFVFENSGHGLLFHDCPALTTVDLKSSFSISIERFERWELPPLKTLVLDGAICQHFDPTALQMMPQLDSLTLTAHSDFIFQWDMKHWMRLSTLRRLSLSGLLARAFRWEMLCQCPNLEALRLSELEAEIVGNIIVTSDDLSTLPVQPAIQSLCFEYVRLEHNVVVEQLPIIFPNLKKLELYCSIQLSDNEMDELKSKFPLLENFCFF